MNIMLLLASAVLTLVPRDYSPAELKELIAGRSDLVVRSADRAHPAVVTGGRTITGWSVGTDGVWRVTLPEVRAERWNFSQLFVNGVSRRRPRVPAKGWFMSLAATRVGKDRDKPDYGIGGFTYAGDVLDPNWANREDLEVQMLFQWNGARLRIREIDAAAHEVVLAVKNPSVASFHSPIGSRFAVENVKEAFGAAGEWYLDRPSGVLSYRPLPGETIGNCRVEAPHDEFLLSLSGARNVTFKDVVFRVSNDVTPYTKSIFTPQGEIKSEAAVRIGGSTGIAFEGCVFANLGSWALSFDEACANCRVSACRMADLGAGGILIGSTTRAVDRITVEDTEIASYGRRHPGAPGIMAIQSANGRFVHNHIYDGYYTGISVGWGWCTEETSHHNEVAFNHIHDIGQRHLSDMGLIYLLCRQPGTRVHHNYLHDITHWGYGSNGIYPDECSGFEEIDHNFVRNTGRCFHSNMIHELNVHDNVFIDGSRVQWDFSSRIGDDAELLHLHHNTFVWTGPRLAVRNGDLKATPEERAAFKAPFWQGLNLHDNVYWNRTGNGRVFPSADWREENQKRLTLAEFQAASGQDRGSVFRDPGELDPLKVCGVTGIRAGEQAAAWPKIESPAPFGLDEQYLLRRPSVEIDMNDGFLTSLTKLRRGGPFTVAFFGGSITAGTSYRPPFTDWLRKTYPQSQITEINAGIGGTGSNLGVYRLKEDVLKHKPDLVFVEFALNDGDRSSVEFDRIGANVESIIRQIWQQDSKTDIIFLYTISTGLYPKFKRGILSDEASIYSLLAYRYRIPVVNFAPRVVKLAEAGKLVWTLGLAPTAVPKDDPDYNAKVAAEMAAQGKIVFSNDGVHPRAEGGRLYVDALTNLFAQTMPDPYVWNRPNLIAGAMFAPDPCLEPTVCKLNPTLLKGAWHEATEKDACCEYYYKAIPSFFISETPGDRLEFTFDGAEAALYALYGPCGARLRVWVDGERLPDRNLFDRYCSYWRVMRVPLFRGARGRHHMIVEIAPDEPERTCAIKYRKLTDADVRRLGFKGHVAAIARLLLDGTLSDF